MRPPGVARGLGSRARAPPPTDAAPPQRSQSAAGSQSGRRTAGGTWHGSERPVSFLRDHTTGARATRTWAPRPAPKVRARGTPRPTWGSWELPATASGLAGAGLGSFRAPLLPKRQGGRGETLPAVGTRSPCCLSLAAGRSPVRPLYLRALGTVHRSAARGPRAALSVEGSRASRLRVAASGAPRK